MFVNTHVTARGMWKGLAIQFDTAEFSSTLQTHFSCS